MSKVWIPVHHFRVPKSKGITSRPSLSTSPNAFISIQFTPNAFGQIVVIILSVCILRVDVLAGKLESDPGKAARLLALRAGRPEHRSKRFRPSGSHSIRHGAGDA